MLPRFRIDCASRSVTLTTCERSSGVVYSSILGGSGFGAVRVYSPEKSIADCFKYRNKIGLDVAIEALRTYRERTRKPDYQALSRFAKVDRVEKVMRPYLEAVL